MAFFPKEVLQVSTLSGTQNFFTVFFWTHNHPYSGNNSCKPFLRVHIMPVSGAPSDQALQHDTEGKVGSVLTASLLAPHPFSPAAPPASKPCPPPPSSPPLLACHPPPELVS